ncbi:MAG: tetratricopeptide repeat-containing sensor histidine kinase [Salinivirgaceae bacterium]
MRQFRYIAILTFLVLGSGQKSQSQPDVDSLLTQLTTTTNDTIYVDILNQLSKACRWNQPIEAIDYAVKAEKISQNCNYQQGLALAYHNLGILYADKGSNELALEYYGKSLQIQRIYNNKKALAHLYDNMGLIFRRQLNYDKALSYHNLSLNLKKELNDTLGIAYSYENIGLIYSEQGKYDKALIHYYNSLRLKESVNDKYGMANSYGNIGVIYLKIESTDQAMVNLERALLIFSEIENKTGIAESQLYLSDIYSKKIDYPKAILALEQCITINNEKGNLKGLADAYLKLGNINFMRKKANLAHDYYLKSLDYYQRIKNDLGIVETRLALAKYYFHQQDFETSKMQLDLILRFSTTLNFAPIELEATKLLASIYKLELNYNKTTELLYRVIELTDTLNKLNLDKEVTQVQMQYEFDKKILQKEFDESHTRLEQAQKVKRISLIRNIALSAFIVLLVLSLIIYRKSAKLLVQNKMLEEQQKIISRNIEELTEQKIQLEKANQTKDKFLAIIGHDLRNPFNAINSFVAKVMEHPQRPDEVMMEKYLHLIKDAGANAQSLLENLLEWAKNQNGELQARKEKITLNYILRGNVLLIKEMAEQKKIAIVEDYEENPIVVIDKNMINAVIRNLLSNALKFTPDGGKIIVKTTIKQNDVKVLVSDTGVGIEPDQLSILFEPHTLKKGVGGIATSGLGLLLSKDFLEKHQQELKVESTVDIGTTFWFYLPITE